MVFSSFVIVVVVGIIHSFFSGMMLYHCVSIILHLKKNLLIIFQEKFGKKRQAGPGQKKWDFFLKKTVVELQKLLVFLPMMMLQQVHT